MLLHGDQPLLVVALPEEAARFDTDLPILYTGVGKVAAAHAVTRCLATSPQLPAAIWNLGTAGALRPGLTGTHEIGLVLQHDFDSETIKAITGQTFGAPLSLGRPGLTLATGDVFVSATAVRDQLARSADLVDMEGYAVAMAATAFNLPVRIIKHVSDDADSSATASWTATVDECSRALAAWLNVS